MSSRIKQIVISAGIVAATGGAMFTLSAFNTLPPLKADKPSAQFVLTSSVTQGDYQPIHRVIGDIEAGQSYQYNAVASADVLTVFKQSGDWVKKGDVILSLDATKAQRDLERLLAQLKELKANQQMQLNQHALDKKLYEFDKKQLKQAKASFAREQKLSSQSLSSNSRLEQLQNEVDAQSQQVLQRELTLLNHQSQQQQMAASRRQLQLNVDAQQSTVNDHQVMANFDGQVSNLTLKVGQQVAAGQSMLTLVDDQRFFKTVVSSSLLEKAEKATPTLRIAETTFELYQKNPLLEANSAGHSLWFDVSNANATTKDNFLVGSRQYANWLSEGIEGSYLVSNRALFEFERIYYLKEKSADVLLEEYVHKDESENMDKDKMAEASTLRLEDFDHWYELVEVKVNLHGSLQQNGDQFWIVTPEANDQLPDSAMILASQITPLYSGMMVTNQVPKEAPKTLEKDNADKPSNDQAGDV